jgi:hypothetical protein
VRFHNISRRVLSSMGKGGPRDAMDEVPARLEDKVSGRVLEVVSTEPGRQF